MAIKPNRGANLQLPSVAIFRETLLRLSETFIPCQVGSLSRFRAVYFGCRRIEGLKLPQNQTILLSDYRLGGLETIAFKLTGWSPRLMAQLKQIRPVLLHAHFGPDAALVLPLVRRLKAPLIVSFHGFDASLTDEALAMDRGGRRYLRHRESLKREASIFIAVSQFIARNLLAQGFPPDRTQVHYIGVDTNEFSPNPQIQRTKTVLFVGRLVEKKGCEYLIRAMEAIQQAMPEVELVIVGDGPLRASLEHLAKSLLRRYIFMGAQSAASIRGQMSRATVFCTPSVIAQSGDAEGFGMVFIEAQSSGLPVVSFSSGGIPEAVKHGKTGYLAPEKDWRTLSRYIAQLLTDDKLWTSFSSAGRTHVENAFNLKVQTAKLEQIYDNTILTAGLTGIGSGSIRTDQEAAAMMCRGAAGVPGSQRVLGGTSYEF
jgi:glycosyltransferase involved in cell wall biosynthesis